MYEDSGHGSFDENSLRPLRPLPSAPEPDYVEVDINTKVKRNSRRNARVLAPLSVLPVVSDII